MVNQTIKILLIEDNPGDVLLLQESLSEISLVNFNWIHVERLQDALERLQTEIFDVILLDLLLPDSRGLASFSTLHQQVPRIPIVVLTGMSDETIALKAMQLGAQDYLVKGKVSSSDLLMRSIRYAIERKRVEATLQQREREFRTLTEHAPDIIARFDQNFRYLFVNPAIEPVTGIPVQSFLGKTIHELGMPEATVAQWDNSLRNVFATAEANSIEFEFPTHDGTRHYQSRCVPEFGIDGTIESALVITRDITEQRQLEVQLFRAQRMESLGTLASGIAHDMNNILTPMLAVAQLLPLKIPNLDPANQHLLKILEDSARRGTDLVKQILAFSRGLEGEQKPVAIPPLLAEVEQILQSTFPKFITITCNTQAADLWQVMADATQLHQVFMNLCVNARDAMPTAGKLSISAENKILGEADTKTIVEARSGNYVLITISDTGIGIPAKELDRIFEPFFTTKEIGKGTGLGLSTAIGIIKNHGGFITVSSTTGQGTQFQIFLPAITQVTPLTPEVTQQPIGQGQLILIVDDEAQIRETLKITLEAYNYQVITAKDGVEAIQTYINHQTDVSVVLIDIIMPSMDGANAILTLDQLNPKLKIIAFSGTATRASLPQVASIKAFLAKPYTRPDLLETIYHVLNEP